MGRPMVDGLGVGQSDLYLMRLLRSIAETLAPIHEPSRERAEYLTAVISEIEGNTE